MKNEKSWKVLGANEDIRIAECRIHNPNETSVSYEEAKATALHMLKEHVAPYLARIAELEQDHFAKSGALPPFRVWKRSYGVEPVIAAKTKKRAMELVRESRYSFEFDWHECGGGWWNHLAQEEGVWIEKRDDLKHGTGIFYRPLAQEEAEQILETHISPYRTMDIEVLLGQVGQTSTATGVSSEGTPYTITTEVRRSSFNYTEIDVRSEIDDQLEWRGRFFASVYRDLPELVSIGTISD